MFNRTRISTRKRLMVISAKGGVGKSTITVNLAAALTARGRHVGIFDADVHGPNIPALLGIQQTADLPDSPIHFMPVEARPDSLDMRPMKPFTRYGMKIMSLALLVGGQQTINPQAKEIGRIMSMMLARIDWGGLDVLLLDMPPGTGEPLNSILGESLVDGAVLVTTRESLAHLDNTRLISLLQAKQVPIVGVVENMTHILCPKCGESIDLYPISAEDAKVYSDIPVLAQIPFHPALIKQRGVPPLPLTEGESTEKAVLLALADKIMDG